MHARRGAQNRACSRVWRADSQSRDANPNGTSLPDLLVELPRSLWLWAAFRPFSAFGSVRLLTPQLGGKQLAAANVIAFPRRRRVASSAPLGNESSKPQSGSSGWESKRALPLSQGTFAGSRGMAPPHVSTGSPFGSRKESRRIPVLRIYFFDRRAKVR